MKNAGRSSIARMHRSLRAFTTSSKFRSSGWGKDDVAEIVTRVDGLSDRSAALVTDLDEHSEGNALFLNEAISVALDRSATERTAGASVADLIAARVGRLGAEARAVAEIAAVAGAGAVSRSFATFPIYRRPRWLAALMNCSTGAFCARPALVRITTTSSRTI